MSQHHGKGEYFAEVNGIKLHYIDHGGDKPLLILMHGLTGNGHAFDGIMADGLGKHYRVICPDLRGNGQSDKPAFCYTVEDHVKDILGLITYLGETSVFIGGHSFGGYLGFYMAANYPETVKKLVVLDAAKAMNPRAAEMLSKAISRLDVTYNNFDEYLEQVKKAPYIDNWDPAMLSYHRADVHDLPEGGVRPNGNIMAITEKSMGLAGIDWPNLIEEITVPTLLVNAMDNYTLGEPLLPEEIARETVKMMKDAKYVSVDGNHQTMLYGSGAKQIAEAITEFLG